MRSLTPQLVPVLQAAMGDPQDQLLDSTRAKLEELVEYLKKTGGK